MKNNLFKILSIIFVFACFTACEDELTELNQNPIGIDPAVANPNMLMPVVLGGAAQDYLDLGFGNIAGAMQHTQKDGWFGGHNHYDGWNESWSGWYGLLRNNKHMYNRAVELDWTFHQGVALTMKSFIFGLMTDLWGDIPYSNALQGNEGGESFEYPTFDAQEQVYNGIIEDLKTAATLFAQGNTKGIDGDNDLYYGGDNASWERFANSLLLRYYMRISEKNPSVAKAGIEAIFNSGKYIQNVGTDATLAYTGQASDIWPTEYNGDGGSGFRRMKPCQTFIDQLVQTNDPRLEVWIAPVHCQWVADNTLETAQDPFIRKDGNLMTGIEAMADVDYVSEIKNGAVFTRHYNPDLSDATLNADKYVGLPKGLMQPSSYNLNPTPGQSVENQHVSQLSPLYRKGGDDLLRARLISAAEVAFILAEAAQKGWAVGDAQTHYEDGIHHSLETWGVADQYEDFIQTVAYDGTLQQIIEQKWVASWTAATEAWFDYRRTQFPSLEAGPAAAQPVLPVRFYYPSDEYINNANNVNAANTKLEVTNFSGARGEDSQWSKMWLLQGTGKPW